MNDRAGPALILVDGALCSRGFGPSAKLLREHPQTLVELVDLRALHGPGRIEQQQAGATWLGIVRELHVAERDLLQRGHRAGTFLGIAFLRLAGRRPADVMSWSCLTP